VPAGVVQRHLVVHFTFADEDTVEGVIAGRRMDVDNGSKAAGISGIISTGFGFLSSSRSSAAITQSAGVEAWAEVYRGLIVYIVLSIFLMWNSGVWTSFGGRVKDVVS